MTKDKQSFIWLFFILLFSSPACAQTRNVWVKANGYFMVPTPGNIPVDENGQPLKLRRDTAYRVFIETQKGNVKWERAWVSGRSFSIVPVATSGAKTLVGEAQNDNRKIELMPAKGNVLWKLELADDGKKINPPRIVKDGTILLKGIYKKRPFYLVVSALVQLASPLYP